MKSLKRAGLVLVVLGFASMAVGRDIFVLHDGDATYGTAKFTAASGTARLTVDEVQATVSKTGSVSTTSILNGTILNADMAANSVASSNIVNGTIANADMAANSILSSNITDGVIVNADVADAAAIDISKIATGGISVTNTIDTDVIIVINGIITSWTVNGP